MNFPILYCYRYIQSICSCMGILGNREKSLRNRMDQGIPGVQSWSSRFVSDFSVALATNESVLTTIINDPRCTGNPVPYYSSRSTWNADADELYCRTLPGWGAHVAMCCLPLVFSTGTLRRYTVVLVRRAHQMWSVRRTFGPDVH